jgi:uncharacterized protein (DUF2235 family)
MAKNIVICCDGTGNQVEGNLSKVLKLFRILQKSGEQRVYYGPGIGTLGTDDPWTVFKQNAKAVFGLATGYGLDDEILEAYKFLVDHYEDGDDIFLFGFSRGAYTVRALAGFINMVGLLPPDQANIADYGLVAYKRSSEKNDLHLAWDFGSITGGRAIAVKFVGVWDTVASMIVPRWDRLYPTLQTLPYTRQNKSVQIFRQAMAIDERRRMFRLNRWMDPQSYFANRFGTAAPQYIKQVWFAGVHADVGGGYPENESGLSKFPLCWLIDEAVQHGLKINAGLKDHLVLGMPYPHATRTYVAPNAAGTLHDSMTWAWRLIEWIPRRVKYEEWPWRLKFDGFYIPCGEPRLIDNPPNPSTAANLGRSATTQHPPAPRIHQSVLDRQKLRPDYRPINFPKNNYVTEPWPYPPAAGTPDLPSMQPPPS